MTSPNTKNAPESYIGSFISLISKYEIRYEGVLYHLNVGDSTIGLKNVKSFGTEGRKKDGPQVLPSERVYEYILFRGSDIKDLEVKSSPPPQKEEQIYQDPAIIQSQYAGISTNSPLLSSVAGKTLTESSSWQDTPTLTSKASAGSLLSHQPGTQVSQFSHPQAAQNAASPSFPLPIYWQGYNGPSNNISPTPFQSSSTVSSPLTGPNRIWTSETNCSPALGSVTASESAAHRSPSIAPSHLNPNFSSSPIPVQCSPAPLTPFPASFKGPLSSTAAYMTDNNPNTSSVPSSCPDTKATEAQISGRAVPGPAHSAQTMNYPASSFLGSASGPLLSPSPSLLTPGQLVTSRPPVLSSTQAMYPDKKDMAAMLPSSFNSPAAISPPVTQLPLLPLPTPNLQSQSQYSTTKFTEEFDFEAMNEKFKKDEVWGYLGKAKQSGKPETIEDNTADQNSRGKEADGLVKNGDPKPAYRKDDFFDTISCNSLNRGTREGQNHFSERMRLDTETFGNFQQRANQGYGGYVAGWGANYRGRYGRGRRYGYGGRGHGGNMHM